MSKATKAQKTILSLAIVLACSAAKYCDPVYAAVCTDSTNTCVVTPPPGDIVGQAYERLNLTNKDFSKTCWVTTIGYNATLKAANYPVKTSTTVNLSLDDSILDGVNLSACDVTGGRARIKLSAKAINLENAITTKFKMPYANMADGKLNFSKSEGGFDLYYANLARGYLVGTIHPRANADHTNFDKAHMERSVWKRGFFNGAYLSTAFLDGADFTEATIFDVNMACRSLNAVKFAGAQIWASNLSGVQWVRVRDGSFLLAGVASQPAEIGGNTWTTLNGVKYWVTKKPNTMGWTLLDFEQLLQPPMTKATNTSIS